MKFKKRLSYLVWTFLCSFLLFFINTKLTGNPGRISYSAISFEDTIERVPELLFMSLCFSVLLYFLVFRYIKED